MIYVVLRRDRYNQLIDAIAVFDNHIDAFNYVNKIDDGSERYSYRIDSVHRNPAI